MANKRSLILVALMAAASVTLFASTAYGHQCDEMAVDMTVWKPETMVILIMVSQVAPGSYIVKARGRRKSDDRELILEDTYTSNYPINIGYDGKVLKISNLAKDTPSCGPPRP